MKFLSGKIEHIITSGANSNANSYETFYTIKLESFIDDIIVRFLGEHKTIKIGDYIYIKKSPKQYCGETYYDFLGYS